MAYGVYSDRGYREHILDRNKNTNKTEVFTQEDQTFTGRKTFLSGVTTSDLEVRTVEVSESLKVKGKDITDNLGIKIDDSTVSGNKTWSSEKINDSLDGKADKEELSKVENSGIADKMLINNSIGRNMSWSELENAKTVTYFTNWDDSTHFPSLYGSGVLIPGLDDQNKYIIYIDFSNIGYINIKTNLGWSGWKQLATTNAVLDSLTVLKGNTSARIIPGVDGTYYRGYEDTSNDIYTDFITKDGAGFIAKIEHGTTTKFGELATMDKVANSIIREGKSVLYNLNNVDYIEVAIDIAKSGYKPIAVSLYNSGTHLWFAQGIYFDDTVCNLSLRGVSPTSATNSECKVLVTYIKTS